jgi:hypothetical protein
MIFIASDVDSLSKTLSRWEIAEYVSECVVIVGCLGELIADVYKGLPEQARRRLERWSTIILILGLTSGLKCLVTTNELSGHVIGSLGDEAASADDKAKQAFTDADKALADSRRSLSQAEDALTKTEEAEAAMKKAFSEATEARAVASSALGLATVARKEADSFEADIASAKKQASDAESHLSEALRQTAKAEAELNRIRTPRSLIEEAILISALKPFSGTEYTLNVFEDDESIHFAGIIAEVLKAAGWIRKQPSVIVIGIPTLEIVLENGITENVPACVNTGISLRAHTKESLAALQSTPVALLPQTVQAAIALKSAIGGRISPPSEQNFIDGIIDPKPAEGMPLTICVGKKP